MDMLRVGSEHLWNCPVLNEDNPRSEHITCMYYYTYLLTSTFVNNQKLEVVASFEYLGSLINNTEDTIKEIKRRTSIALQKLKQLKKLLGRTDGTTKIRFFRACIFPIATHDVDT
jgi:hypothetical protein